MSTTTYECSSPEDTIPPGISTSRIGFHVPFSVRTRTLAREAKDSSIT